MQIVSNTLSHAYPAHFIHSLTANFCGKIVYLVDQMHLQSDWVQLKIPATIQRIALIAISILSLVAIMYYIAKNNAQIAAPQPQTQPQLAVTVATEIECAKKEILARLALKDSDFDTAVAAKLLLTVQHGGKVFLKTVILTQAVSKDQILKHLDILVNDIQDEIVFDQTSKTKVAIGILAKGSDYKGLPMFSNKITAHATAYQGETSNPGFTAFTKILASAIQNSFCNVLGIQPTPQLDAQGNFI